MVKTNAERQSSYRKRRGEAGDNGERRINMWVPTGTALALKRLARRNGIPQREMLARLVYAADDAVLKSLEPDSKEWDEYFGITQ